MTTTVRQVERYLETDLVLNEALSRGFLNIRRAARWLIENQGWDTTEEAVVSALRRYRPESSVDLENTFHILSQTRRTARTGLAVVGVPRKREQLSRIPSISQALDAEATFGLLPDDEGVNILVDEENLETVLDLLGRTGESRVRRGVAEVELELPESGPAASTAVAVLLNVMGYRGVEVIGVSCILPICSLYLVEPDFGHAYELVVTLSSRSGSIG